MFVGMASVRKEFKDLFTSQVKTVSCWLNNLIRLLRFLQNSCALEQLKRSFTFPTYRTLACTASCIGGRLNVPGDFLCMFAFICTPKINNGLPSPRSPPTIVRRSMLACEQDFIISDSGRVFNRPREIRRHLSIRCIALAATQDKPLPGSPQIFSRRVKRASCIIIRNTYEIAVLSQYYLIITVDCR